MILLPLIPALILVLMLWVATLMIRQSWPKSKRIEPVTVVVCARDEEPAILECLLSLSEQTFPDDQYEILLVDHLSKDRTGEIMDMFAEESSIRTRVIHVTEEDGELQGKVQALNIGLEHVTTEFVLLTDGDCAVPETWIMEMMAYMEDDVAIINGHVRVQDPDREDSQISRMQNTLNRMFLAFSAGMSALQLPRELYHPKLRPFASLLQHVQPSFNMGNNQGLRMSAYNEIGGFRDVGPTLIEDVALVNRILKKTRYKVAVIVDPLTIVTTRPSRNLREYWRQYRRWASAMDNIHNNANTILYALLWINRVALPWMVLLFPISGLLALGLTAIAEYRLIMQANQILGTRTTKREVGLHLISQSVINQILSFALVLRVPVVWKGRVYEK
jgi:cellulose synthase/poly-beta-1,6-N-acetylglucosamine synthase-like glycosyltransferase